LELKDKEKTKNEQMIKLKKKAEMLQKLQL